MNKDVIKSLCKWMAMRHDINIDRIRVGSNQRTRHGSASMRTDIFTGEVKKLNVSISSYSTNSNSEFWNTHNKIAVLSTIVHEFAHLNLFKEGRNVGHGETWKNTYHKMLADDWKELIQMYNILSGDSLSSDFSLLFVHCEDSYLSRLVLERIVGEKTDPALLVRGIVDKKESVAMTLMHIGNLGIEYSIGNKCIILEFDGEQIGSLLLEKKDGQRYFVLEGVDENK